MTDFTQNGWHPARFWIPEAGPENAVSGTYEVNRFGAARIHLMMSPLRERFFYPRAEERSIDLLHGEVFGKSITLVDCRIRNFRANLGELAKIEYESRMSFEGLLLKEEELLISDAYLAFHDQHDWAQWRAFSTEDDSGNPNDFNPTAIRLVRPEPITATLAIGNVSIEDASYISPGMQIGLESRSRFSVFLNNPTPLDKFHDACILPLSVMMATASGRVGGVKEIRATNRDWRLPDGSELQDPWVTVRLRSKVDSTLDRKSLDWSKILFTLSDMDWTSQGPYIFSVIPKWNFVVEQWALLLHPEFGLAVPRFIGAVQATEALDRLLVADPENNQLATTVDETLRDAGWNSRRRSKVRSALRHSSSPSLEERLRRRAGDLGPAMTMLTEDRTWPSRVAKLRNIVSHGLSGSDDLEKIVAGSQIATEILLHILEATFLKNLKFSDDEVVKMMDRRSNFGWRKSNVEEGLSYLPN